nr:MAG TPA: hypothetical protein [Caudoviricetes sp.]
MFNQDSFHNVLNITIKGFANSKKDICCDIFIASHFCDQSGRNITNFL